MKISQKGLYALPALMMLARNHRPGAIKIRDIASEQVLPEKFLKLKLFLDVRDDATRILDNTTLAGLTVDHSLPMVTGGRDE